MTIQNCSDMNGAPCSLGYPVAGLHTLKCQAELAVPISSQSAKFFVLD